MSILKIVAGVLVIPALVIMFSECSDLGLTWLRFVSAGYAAILGLVASREENSYGLR